MPNLNLKDDEVVHEEPMAPRLRKRDEGTQNKGVIVVLYVVLILVVLAAAAFFLDRYGVIKLWGSKQTAVKRVSPPPPAEEALAAEAAAKADTEKAAVKKDEGKKSKSSKVAATTALKEARPARSTIPVQPAASGEFAVQISSWTEEEKAVAHADQLKESGLEAYIVKVGERWTVRIGRYPSQQEARDAAAHLGENSESRVIVVKAQ